MAAIRKEIVTFVLGAGLTGAGIASLPLSEVLITAGGALLAFSYGTLLLGWRTGAQAGKAPTQPSSPAQPAFSTPQAPQPQSVSAPTAPTAPSAPRTPSPGTPTPPTAPSAPSGTGGEAPTPPTAAMPSPPGAPSIEQPKPPGRKLPSLKAPQIQLPKFVVENKVPMALLAAGLIVLIAGLLVLGVPPQPLVGIGLLIPGGLFFGLGAILLYQRLRPRMVEVVTRRFCMHCGFQMSSTDVSCPRCRRQPPSGVDTKACPNCGAVIPNQAKFCRDCGAGQPTAPQ